MSSISGRQGESLAAEHLKTQGLEILAQRFRAGRGEVDIIAREGDVLVFVEVKTWRSLGMTELQYSLNRSKQKRILSASLEFLRKEGKSLEETSLRFDLVFIYRNEIRHIRSAWHWDGGM